MAVVEVQRFWYRFKQLGCDKSGNLPKKIIEKNELSQDLFVKNVYCKSFISFNINIIILLFQFRLLLIYQKKKMEA